MTADAIIAELRSLLAERTKALAPNERDIVYRAVSQLAAPGDRIRDSREAMPWKRAKHYEFGTTELAPRGFCYEESEDGWSWNVARCDVGFRANNGGSFELRIVTPTGDVLDIDIDDQDVSRFVAWRRKP